MITFGGVIIFVAVCFNPKSLIRDESPLLSGCFFGLVF